MLSTVYLTENSYFVSFFDMTLLLHYFKISVLIILKTDYFVIGFVFLMHYTVVFRFVKRWWNLLGQKR